MKCQTWNVTVPNAIQIENSKKEASKKDFKEFCGNCDLKITFSKNDSVIKTVVLSL